MPILPLYLLLIKPVLDNLMMGSQDELDDAVVCADGSVMQELEIGLGLLNESGW